MKPETPATVRAVTCYLEGGCREPAPCVGICAPLNRLCREIERMVRASKECNSTNSPPERREQIEPLGPKGDA